jgi:prevent-host-death family protein
MYTVHQTKTNLSKILKEVEQGKEVVIARGDKPIAKIVPLDRPIRRKAGSLKGILSWESGAFDPLTEEELKQWGIE